MFGVIKLGAIAAAFAWIVASYGHMLGLSASQISMVATTADGVTAGAITPEQKAKAQAAIKQVTPPHEELQVRAKALTPVILGKIEEGKTATIQAVVQMREGMDRRP